MSTIVAGNICYINSAYDLVGLEIDSSGNMYVSNHYTESIFKISVNGSISIFADGLQGIQNIVFDNFGNLYYTSSIQGYIGKIDPYGNKTIIAYPGQCTGIAIDNSGNIYCAAIFQGIIYKINVDGTTSIYTSGLNQPNSITFDNLGNLYCCSYENSSILKITNNGSTSTIYNGGSGLKYIKCNKFGNLYGCGKNGINTIIKFYKNITVSVLTDVTPKQPTAFAFNNSGEIYCLTSDGYILTNFIEYQFSNICFPAGTPIQTDQEIIAIEKIKSNKNTIRGNKIETITKTIIQDSYLVCIEKDALAKNIPNKKTVISKNHKLFYNKKMIKSQELLNLNNEGVYKIPYNGEALYNILLENHDKMIVNNLICETLDPKNGIAKMHLDMKNNNFTEEQKQDFINNYNNYVMITIMSSKIKHLQANVNNK
uniref:Hedgehog/Intein (Hint) domain-containing protein n=1 Tax=viral metagenome TaxID=1070528 RepID=A0A6C0IRL5_9ZZZZ